ncbi:MAG: ABC transporter ATP-binding protein [Rhodospirillaceae bacterium]|jgi:lipoprotein-releasing system ATP-binding protein|nr:ABC transporter ATP-binding protein [Rhodospirillaceae bacterium]MBT3490746.1 ABC transporter ATP-binding protein [Rhodospirillaceae bacterium]MBT3783049.1 ABC transporter ATP-binding protein [Rhodospirillaceae bacterium]MBT3976350.1 ABC transporter ATP-binding protein [Rhodospirillaceae bacterium]MBT4169907.1 ABC transporter ATP-binding protein [Rhodospirillaceae bacterium]
MSDDGVLRITGLARAFVQGGRRLEVLRGLDLTIEVGEAVALMGPSGSGKSTLLHAAGLLEEPDAGDIMIAGQNCAAMNDGQRTAMRRDHVGFVYQFHHLLPEFTALENVLMPMRLAKLPADEASARAEQLLAELGLADRLGHAPGQLSGGEQQRVAIARALANQPVLLLADEPTGNLDQATAEMVLSELLSIVRGRGLGMLVATHDPLVADRLDRVVRLQDGCLVDG